MKKLLASCFCLCGSSITMSYTLKDKTLDGSGISFCHLGKC